MKNSFLCIAFLIAATLCTEAGDVPPQTSPAFIKANSQFALKLFREVVRQNPNKNVAVAPVGLSLSFALLFNGASATAQQQIASTFGFEGISTTELNRSAKLLVHDLSVSSWKNDDTGVVRDFKKGFRLSNSLWLKPSESLRPAFSRANNSFYQFRLVALPQDSRRAAAALNRFVKSDSHGQLPSLELQPHTDDIVLLSSTHFGCGFGHPFGDGGSSEFTLGSGKKSLVRMMMNMKSFPYVRGDHFQAVSVDCGEVGELRMFLPDEDYSVDRLLSALDLNAWQEWTRPLWEQEHSYQGKAFILMFPHIRVEHQADFRGILSRLGAPAVFENLSSLSQVVSNPRGAKLTRVFQTTYVEVNEREIRAGSVDYVGGIAGGVMGGSPPPKLVLNRPFLFTITDRDTGSILFIGVVNDPSGFGA